MVSYSVSVGQWSLIRFTVNMFLSLILRAETFSCLFFYRMHESSMAGSVTSPGSPTSAQKQNTSVALTPTESTPTHAPPQNSAGELMISTRTKLLNELHEIHCEKMLMNSFFFSQEQKF